MLHLPRVMFAAPASGSGKTMITCGVLEAFRRRGLRPASFKCGPDYIDPMFHTRVIGTPSKNLDTFFTGAGLTRWLFARTAQKAGISVFEGVMGFYDGLGGISVQASSWELASVTETPVILIVNARGMSLSVIPLIQGYLNYQKHCGKEVIRGVILNQTAKSTYKLLKDKIRQETGVLLCGYVPCLSEAAVESRHLGLVTPGEITDLRKRLGCLSEELEESLDLDAILTLAEDAPDYGELQEAADILRMVCSRSAENDEMCRLFQSGQAENEKIFRPACGRYARIAVARDEAFCFYYEDNLELLRLAGAELVNFSPLHDKGLPKGISGLLLGGGYPELYAQQLSENKAMQAQIRAAIGCGLPYLAECGGFMYLHEFMEDMEGRAWPMCGVIRGKAYRTERLRRFGYITLSSQNKTEDAPGKEDLKKINHFGQMNSQARTDEPGNMIARPEQLLAPGETIRGHEFHYFDSTDPGGDYLAKKPAGMRSWTCIHGNSRSAAGYPHLYYWSNPAFVLRFVRQAYNYIADRHFCCHDEVEK